MPGYNSQRRGTARNVPKIFVLFYVLFVLYCSVYCLCVNVYCTTATRWQPNCSLTNISYHISCIKFSKNLCTPRIADYFNSRFSKLGRGGELSFLKIQTSAIIKKDPALSLFFFQNHIKIKSAMHVTWRRVRMTTVARDTR
jgi:hypothetical protein